MLNSNIFQNIFFIIVLITMCEAIAQSCLKKYNLDKNHKYFALALLFYFFVILLLCKSYNYETMGLVNLCWSAFSIVLVIISGIILFHEKITYVDVIGVFIIIFGLYLIFVHGHNK